MKPPFCKLCDTEHWSWQPHAFPINPRDALVRRLAMQGITSVKIEKPDTKREGRGVLKGEKPTPTPARAKAVPPKPAKAPAKATTAEKVKPGKPKTAPKPKPADLRTTVREQPARTPAKKTTGDKVRPGAPRAPLKAKSSAKKGRKTT